MPDPAKPLAVATAPDLGQNAAATSVNSNAPSATTKALTTVPNALTQARGNPAVLRDAHGRLLPGQSLNPTGRTRGLASRVRDLIDFDLAINTLAEIAWGKLAPASRVADRIKAIELLMDRGFGKPQQAIEVNDKSAAGPKFRQMDTPKLIATVEALRALQGKQDDIEDAEEVH